ncbi:tRNA threonylcarbamoyl adenosine modification protein YeaZ [Quadrisphaera granulorum]|uniref:tRNA threonylcarbamoyl adenosine modification protein YeaZ n=1 Tax=Quadrisphaera granulorum TaxID=317664 RepID=A0A316ADE0_9ACTN|nr:tRNA (adenosine(37)-N6)-threonylcarbamoyltransferase complex dimerization subunit type 1 TsaB [Quadrisphaera granulorum]PWJ55429.1 tRNA threonylcarbamoyl adenosine modification protein YeaZ [Quadrisphaera granulorum]SZE95493.1 tRNA threonylcarbamoyl adenosine modification protein YeaZ [Quadrisphaera granulorum]
MLLLALDTSSAVGVALLEGERVLAQEQHHDPRRHGELLAPSVRSVLAAAGVDRRDLGAVAVGVGPAPFTGLRVGVVTALALGEALGIPVHGVSSLDALAASALAAAPVSARGPLAGGFVVAADARRREVHWARIAIDGGADALADPLSGWRRTAGPAVDTPADVAAGIAGEGLPAVGRGAALYRDTLPGPDVLAGASGDAHDTVELPLDPDPGVLGALVARRLATGGELLPPRPMYLRRPDAQVPAALAGR